MQTFWACSRQLQKNKPMLALALALGLRPQAAGRKPRPRPGRRLSSQMDSVGLHDGSTSLSLCAVHRTATVCVLLPSQTTLWFHPPSICANLTD